MALTTSDQIETFRLITLRAALRLELLGMKSRGPSAYSVLKAMGFSGSRQKVFQRVSHQIDQIKSTTALEQTA
jgi:succinylarginine dihydrolase